MKDMKEKIFSMEAIIDDMKQKLPNIDAIIDETGEAFEKSVKHLTEIYHNKYLPAYEFIERLLDKDKTRLSLEEFERLLDAQKGIIHAHDEALNFLKANFFPVYEKLSEYMKLISEIFYPFVSVYNKDFEELHTNKYILKFPTIENNSPFVSIYRQDKFCFKAVIYFYPKYISLDFFATIFDPSLVSEGMLKWLENPLIAVGKDLYWMTKK